MSRRLLLFLILLVGSASSQENDPNEGIRLPVGLSEGVPIQRVHVHLRNPLEVLPEGFQDSVIESLGLWAGDPFNFILADEGRQRIRQKPEVAEAEYRLYQGDIAGRVIVAVLLLLRDSGAAPEASPAPDPGFPVLHQDEASKLQLIVNGAWGAYSENNPWFGDSRVFLGPTAPFGSPLSWGEGLGCLRSRWAPAMAGSRGSRAGR